VVTVIKARVTTRLGVFDESYTISFLFKSNLTLLKASAIMDCKAVKIGELHQFDGWPLLLYQHIDVGIIHYNN